MLVLTFPEGAKADEMVVDLYDRLATGEPTPQLLQKLATETDLYAWLVNLYRKKGGADEVYNAWSVRLVAEDLDALEQAAGTDNLAGMPGLTFCDPRQGEQQDEDAIAIVTAARQALAQRLIVFVYAF